MESREDVMRLEQARRDHCIQFGSMLHCPKRGVLCFQMNNQWLDGCQLETCVLDDPQYIELKKKQEEARIRRAIAILRREQEEHAPIRNQTCSRNKELRRQILILERRSQDAYRRGRPNEAQILFNKAQILKGKLK